ncbi:reverse transcriptase domain-containing protein [Bradyrhizobium sp. HKCCYLR20261]|uniref:reverse transcriptase domain-containing protein n=1 Tax=Bradyrhizobium sp. HKCCYLR20261 TaxID=3420760 RepID=UPI003EBCAFD4
MKEVWSDSKDATSRAGSPGIDNQTARQFAANLDANLSEIEKRLRAGSFGFSRLRPIFIAKPNSNKERVICVPTVRDRLVQRTIVEHLTLSEALPIYNSSSFGFVKGQGTAKAIDRAVELRSLYDWCVKADIEAFFDQISRKQLKERVAAALPRQSLVPLIWSAIDCEVRGTREVLERIARQGIHPGRGIRQGMPLSPLLANLTLSKFDRTVEREKIPMIRYADDLLMFFSTKEEASAGREFVEKHLSLIGLKLSQAKTSIYGPKDNVVFLGLEIAFLDKLGKFVSRVSRPQIRKIRDRLESEFTLEKLTNESVDMSAATVRLSRSVAAYLGAYQKAHDFVTLRSELERCMKEIQANLYVEVFGPTAFDRLDDRARKFLGIFDPAIPPPSEDFDH